MTTRRLVSPTSVPWKRIASASIPSFSQRNQRAIVRRYLEGLLLP